MIKIAFVFPGQGAQAVGMGQDFYAEPTGRAIYDAFDKELSDLSLSQICFKGPEETLRRTLYTQPAILATSLAALSIFQSRCPQVKPLLTAGHSLGEYAALYAAGAISLNTAIHLIRRRAQLMEEAPSGAMSVVLGLSVSAVEAVLSEFKSSPAHSESIVVVANENADQQIVISGDPIAVESVSPLLKAAGAKRVMPLPVGGAFHSPLMHKAAIAFAEHLNGFEILNAQFPVFMNVDASPTQDAHQLREKLALQMDHGVCWNKTMHRMVIETGIDTVIEFGPGKVLTGLFKKSAPDLRVFNIQDQSSLDHACEEFSLSAHPA